MGWTSSIGRRGQGCAHAALVARVPDLIPHVSQSDPALADKYHLIAPDYPGYGHSSMPRA